MQVAEDLLKVADAGSGLQADVEESFVGTDGGTAISAAAQPAPDVKFGAVKQRKLEDAVALRQKLAGTAA